MSDYNYVTVSNWFQATSEEELRKAVENILRYDDIEVKITDDNKKLFKLSFNGCFSEDNEEDYSYNDLIENFQKILPEGEVLTIFVSGHEKLRYVDCSVTVITNKKYKTKSLYDMAKSITKDLL